MILYGADGMHGWMDGPLNAGLLGALLCGSRKTEIGLFKFFGFHIIAIDMTNQFRRHQLEPGVFFP